MKMWYRYTMQYYSTMKQNNNAICSNMDELGDCHIKSVKSERQILCDITSMRNLKYNTNELIYKTDSQPQRTDLWLPRESGKNGFGVWGQQMQTIIYRMDKQQVLLYSTGKCIQYFVKNHNGKAYIKECKKNHMSSGIYKLKR